MKALKIFLLFVLVSHTTTAFSQATTEGIRKDLDHYGELLRNQDFDSLLYYVNPKLFDILPRDMFVESIQMLFGENEQFKISLGDFEYTRILDVLEINNRSFSFIDYKMEMYMDFYEPVEDAMLSMMQVQFGSPNVTLSDDGKRFTINVDQAMFSEYLVDRWTFVRYDSTQQGLLDMLVEKEIREKLLSARYAAPELEK